MAYRPILLSFVATLAAVPTLAQVAAPPSIRTKIQVMDTACAAVGGRPAGGTYIFSQDFSGDGVKDFLVSEGNYTCAGKPEAFRPSGHAIIEIYVTQGADSPRVFYESVRGYRIIPGAPSQLQIVRDSGTVTLRYDPAQRRFVTAAPGAAPPTSAPAPQVAVDPLAGVGPRPVAAPPTVASSGAPETQAAFLSRCRTERMSRYKDLPQKIADSSCQEIWRQAQTTIAAASALLAVGGGAPGPMAQAAVRGQIAGATWGGTAGPGVAASGKLGPFDISLHGQSLVDSVSLDWGKVGQPIPFDMVEAMKIKGARVSEVACQAFGSSEQTHVYRVDFAGRPTFGLTVYGREAPTASASSSYVVTADLKGPAPTLASVKRTKDGADFAARCED